ncbi:restriction endonuclease subunit S [Pseudomonas sp. 8O]|uniref:restriction endonuclease subunit S n=1 Tax=Pseudomonas sp. 8O TaxID=2653165 RepID=UPI0012F274E2|nr:restriction endonuclease subunit S [Pseudomonas sp. 8O]VXC35274.1 Type I restriction-modification enzyme S subunit [Pseudomonas sp. 8O]
MEVRPGYKQTEIGVIPEEWEVVALGSLTTTVASGKSSSGAVHGTYPVHGSTGVIGYTEQPEYEGDSILAARVGANAGKLNLVSGKYGVTDNTIILRLRRGYSLPFFWRLLETKRLNSLVFGSGQPLITGSQLKALLFSVPPLPEQRTIATALSDMDAVLGALERLIAKKRDLKQAAMQQLLTGQTRLPGFSGEWEETTLGAIGECVIGLTYRPDNVVEYGLLVLRSSNIQGGRLAYESNVYVDLEVNDRLMTRPGDILVCVRNGSRTLIGKSAVIDECAAGTTFGAFMTVYRTTHWRFISHAFQSESIQRQIRDNIGATINQITNKDMKALRLKLPSACEQIAIATVLSDMDAELVALEQLLAKTRALKQGMMQELLTGRTRLV